MEFCHALTCLPKIQPLSGMGDLCMVFKIRLFSLFLEFLYDRTVDFFDGEFSLNKGLAR